MHTWLIGLFRIRPSHNRHRRLPNPKTERLCADAMHPSNAQHGALGPRLAYASYMEPAAVFKHGLSLALMAQMRIGDALVLRITRQSLRVR